MVVRFGRIRVDPGTDPDDLNGNVVKAAAKVGQVDQVAASVSWVETSCESADLMVVDRSGEAVGAKQEDVGELNGQRPLDVDLDVWLRPQAASDDVTQARISSPGPGEIGGAHIASAVRRV